MAAHSNRPKTEHPFAVRVAHWVGRNWARINYARRIEPTWLELNPHNVAVENLPTSFEGFKIAHLSDLHHGHHMPEDFLPKAVDVTLEQKPDLIALTGDFVHKGYKHVEEIAKVMGRLKAPHGVYAVLGNHDFSVRNALGFRRYRGLHKAIADALSSQGVRVLRNESLHLDGPDGKLIVSGLDDLWSRECDPDQALDGHCTNTPRVILAHNPQTIHLMNKHRCDFMLSGHTHGGQINWPGLGRVFLGRKGRQFAAGMYRHNDSHLYVHKGVGFGLRLRFGVRPEIALHTLRRS